MKIKAKDIKKGMTVTTGTLSIKVEEVVKGTLKNGNPTIMVKGQGFFSVSGHKTKALNTCEQTFKELTKVTVKS